MTRPSAQTLRRLATALDEVIGGARIEKLWCPTDTTLLIRIGRLKPRRLLIDVTPGHPSVLVTTRWPATPAAPNQTTLRFRGQVEGAVIRGVRAVDDRQLTFEVTRGGGAMTLIIQLAGRFPNAAVRAGDEETVRLRVAIRGTDDGAPPLPSRPDEAWPADDDAFLDELAARTWQDVDLRVVASRRRGARKKAREALKKLRRTCQRLAAQRDKADAADADRRAGELLKGALHQIKRGAKEALVPDWANHGEPTVIPLDPQLGPVANMERYFARYRKFSRAQAGTQARWDDANRQLAALEALIDDAPDVDGPFDQVAAALAEVDAFEAALRRIDRRPTQQARPRQGAAVVKRPYWRFEAEDGTPILVGKGARDNDQLTFQVARGQDVWLHARDFAGSHVVLRAPRDGEPSAVAMRDAALLAAWLSKARGDAVADVMWTRRKFVRKARGAAPGRVTVSDSKTLTVRIDASRIEMLYASRDADLHTGQGAG